MTDDAQLLHEYAMGSESAFRELVERYVNLVYSAAIRHLEEASLAQDVVQTVFSGLARKAKTLPRDVILGGWLYRHTCFVASQAARTERRRRARERQAVEMNALNNQPEPDWERLAPFLDQAMQGLGTHDRNAVVLRYFEGRNLRTVGAALGISEEAARKRVTRALEKLRGFFAGRGITLSATALAALLAEKAVVAAPAGMAATVSAAALASGLAGTGSMLTFVKLIAMTKIKVGIVGAIVVAAVVTPLALQHQSRARLFTVRPPNCDSGKARNPHFRAHFCMLQSWLSPILLLVRRWNLKRRCRKNLWHSSPMWKAARADWERKCDTPWQSSIVSSWTVRLQL